MTIKVVKNGVVKKYRVDLVVEAKDKIKIVYYKKTELKEGEGNGEIREGIN